MNYGNNVPTLISRMFNRIKISELIKTLPTEIYHGKYRRENLNAERRWLQVGGRPPPGEGEKSEKERLISREPGEEILQ